MLETKDLCRTYKTKQGITVAALDHVNLKFPSVGMVFILGKSGSGKSTLLNVLGGLDKYDQGEIIIKGKSSKDFRQSEFDSYRNTYLGFIFQEYNILDEFSVGANIGLAIELQGRKASNDEINKIMAEVDLVGYGSRKPNELSGGQKQRVAIARALVKNPEIIMADEPTGALDSKTGIQVFDTLKKLSKTKLVIVVSHDREFAEQYGDHVIELADGKIISDIEKHLVSFDGANGTKVERGISIIDDSIIRIQAGYLLTSDDLQLINKYLEKTKTNSFLSIDDATNDKVRQMARINDDGSKETFKNTDQKRIVLKEDEHFKLIKSRLSIKHSVKMGASGLKVKPFRLFITILLSFIAFTLFGLADTMAAYNKVDAGTQSIIDSEIKSFAMTKEIDYNYGTDSDYQSWSTRKLDDVDLALLKEKTGFNYKGIYNNSLYYSNTYKTFSYSAGQFYYQSSQSSGFATITPTEASELGFNLLSGTWPAAKDEIMITGYNLECYKEFGFKSASGEEITNVTAEALVGKYINFSCNDSSIRVPGDKVKIVGVLDTKLDVERYASLMESTESESGSTSNNLISMYLSNELNSSLYYGYHNLTFMSQELSNEFNQLGTKKSIYMPLSNQAFSDSGNTLSGQYLSTVSDVEKISFLSTGKASLSKNEFVTDIQTYLGAYQSILSKNLSLTNEQKNYILSKDSGIMEDSLNLDTYVSMKNEDAIQEYSLSPAKYALAQSEGFEGTMSEFSDAVRYEKWNYQDLSLFKETEGLFYKVWIDIIKENKSTIESLGGFTFGLSNDYESDSRFDFVPDEMKLVGFTLRDATDYSSIFFVNEEIFDSVDDYSYGKYNFALASMPSDKEEIHKVVDYSYNNEFEGSRYTMKNSAIDMLSTVNSFVEGATSIFLYIGIGFAVFSSLLLFNFISISISYKKREIGILRAVGARSRDVFKIFFSESAIIAIVNAILAVIALIVVANIINKSFRDDLGLLITFFNVGIRQIALLFAVSILVAFISSFFPVYKIAIKRPIDAIRNR